MLPPVRLGVRFSPVLGLRCPVEWLSMALPSYPRFSPKSPSSSISSLLIVSIIFETSPRCSSRLTTFERKREKLELLGAGLRGGESMTITPALPSLGSILYLGRLCRGTEENPHAQSSDELLPYEGLNRFVPENYFRY